MNLRIANLDDNREIRELSTTNIKFYDCFFEEQSFTIFFPDNIAKEIAEYYTESLEEDPYDIWDIREDVDNYFLDYSEVVIDKVIELIEKYGNKVSE